MAIRTVLAALLALVVLAKGFPAAAWSPWPGHGEHGGGHPDGYAGHGNHDWAHGYGQGDVDADDGVVDLGYARYEGTKLSSGVNQFLGMRYAAPPLGNNRFRAPQPPVREPGVQKAQLFGNICVGTGEQVGAGIGEDCLFINVFAPANATPGSKLKVWFYIQGGGYANNSNANYNGTEVVVASDHNIILVNFNYRVGALGFLASEKVRADGALNAGLLDQRAALEWVQKYIHLFGGDPQHVVIHGASAGGGSVAFHMTAYGGRDDGLFVGAIPESPFFPTHRTVAQMEFQYDRFVQQIGCQSASDSLDCARTTDIDTIQAANVLQAFPGGPSAARWYFLPVIDGTFSQDYLYSQFLKGKFVKVPTMVAGDTDEGTYFAPPSTSSEADVQAFIKSNYPNLEQQQLNQVTALYPPNLEEADDNLPNAGVYFNAAQLSYGDSTFTCGGQVISQALTNFVSAEQSWNYRYNVQDPSYIAQGLGVPHTSETPAIFGFDSTGGGASSLTTTNTGIVPVVMGYYLSFVRTLDPNNLRAAGAPEWAPYRGSDGKQSPQRLLIETGTTRMEKIPDVQRRRCKLWDSLYETMQQ